jgi:hypothetical protein
MRQRAYWLGVAVVYGLSAIVIAGTVAGAN